MRVRFRHRFAAGAQRTVCRVVMFFLFRALNALSVRDSRVAAEIAPWPEARVLGLEVPGGPSLYIARRAVSQEDIQWDQEFATNHAGAPYEAGTPVYTWHIADTVDDVRIPLPAQLTLSKKI